jgi:hypothetical protein
MLTPDLTLAALHSEKLPKAWKLLQFQMKNNALPSIFNNSLDLLLSTAMVGYAP